MAIKPRRKAEPVGVIDWIKGLWGTWGFGRSFSGDLHDTADYSPVAAMALATGKIKLRAGVYSTVGNYREHNEDNYYVPGIGSLHARTASYRPVTAGTGAVAVPAEEPTSVEVPPSPTRNDPFIVADGMGGQMAGERASQMAVDIIPVELRKRLAADTETLDDRTIRHAVRDALSRANEEILAQSHLDTECNNMGTTVVLTLFCQGRAYITGIGDSRAYRLRDRKLEQLTEDHSLANALAKAQTIRPDEVESHKFKHVLYLYLGSRDVGAGPEEVRSLDVRPGDRFLLATDGLTGVVRDDEIAAVLDRMDDPQRAAEHLVQRAIDSQSKDNITCVVVYVEASPEL
jgi:protein phosphatase